MDFDNVIERNELYCAFVTVLSRKKDKIIASSLLQELDKVWVLYQLRDFAILQLGKEAQQASP